MRHVFGAVLLGVAAVWIGCYANEFGINQWWVLPANITMAICLVGAAFWLAAGIAEILEG